MPGSDSTTPLWFIVSCMPCPPSMWALTGPNSGCRGHSYVSWERHPHWLCSQRITATPNGTPFTLLGSYAPCLLYPKISWNFLVSLCIILFAFLSLTRLTCLLFLLLDFSWSNALWLFLADPWRKMKTAQYPVSEITCLLNLIDVKPFLMVVVLIYWTLPMG